jgi:hypothetical protein
MSVGNSDAAFNLWLTLRVRAVSRKVSAEENDVRAVVDQPCGVLGAPAALDTAIPCSLNRSLDQFWEICRTIAERWSIRRIALLFSGRRRDQGLSHAQFLLLVKKVAD